MNDDPDIRTVDARAERDGRHDHVEPTSGKRFIDPSPQVWLQAGVVRCDRVTWLNEGADPFDIAASTQRCETMPAPLGWSGGATQSRSAPSMTRCRLGRLVDLLDGQVEVGSGEATENCGGLFRWPTEQSYDLFSDPGRGRGSARQHVRGLQDLQDVSQTQIIRPEVVSPL